MTYKGDFAVGATVRFMWNTFAIAGESITRATNGTISVYKDGGTTQSTAGVTDTEDFDGLTGVHYVAIDTSADGAFYNAGSDFAVVLSGATIDGKAINAVLAEFSIQNRAALRPTVAGRTLDVSAGGEAGIDWANIGSPTTTVNLSGTNIDTDQVVASVTNGVTVTTNNDKTGYALSAAGVLAIWHQLVADIVTIGSMGAIIRDALDEAISSRSTLTAAQVWSYVTRTLTATSDSAGVTTLLSRISAALSFTSGRVNAQVGGMDANVLTDTALANSAVSEIQQGLSTLTDLQIYELVSNVITDSAVVTTTILNNRTLPAADYATASAVAAIATIVNRLNTMLELAGSDYRFTVAALANAPGGGSAADVADAVLDELISGHAISGSLAAAISAIEGKTALIGSASALITQEVVDESGDLYISKGKDYKGSRAPSWSRTITYAGATISTARLNVAGLSITGSITNSGGVVTVSADISRTAFDSIAAGVYPFEVELDLTVGSNTEIVQFTTGKCRVSANL